MLMKVSRAAHFHSLPGYPSYRNSSTKPFAGMKCARRLTVTAVIFDACDQVLQLSIQVRWCCSGLFSGSRAGIRPILGHVRHLAFAGKWKARAKVSGKCHL